MPTQYRIYLNRTIQGPYDLDELLKLENLSKETLVCEVGDLEWEKMGSCRDIQDELATKPMKWGAIHRTLLTVSFAPPENTGTKRTVSASGDYVPRVNRPNSAAKADPAKKQGMFGWMFSWWK